MTGVQSPREVGDSITDGFNSTVNANARWPNAKATRGPQVVLELDTSTESMKNHDWAWPEYAPPLLSDV